MHDYDTESHSLTASRHSLPWLAGEMKTPGEGLWVRLLCLLERISKMERVRTRQLE